MYISGIHTYEEFYGRSITEPSQSSPQQEVPAESDDRCRNLPQGEQASGIGTAQGDIACALSGLQKDRVLVRYQFFVGTGALSGKEDCKEEHFCL